MINKNKFIAIITSSLLLINGVSAGYDEVKDNGYKAPIFDSSIIKFEAKRDGYKVKMHWSNYNKEDFQYYKIMRSETHENPVYPDQHALQYLDNNDVTEYEIKDYAQKDVIYRICVISKQKDRYCSNTVKVKGFEKKDYSEYKKEEYKKKYEYDKDKYKKEYEKKKLEYQKKSEEYKKKYEEKKMLYKKQYDKNKANVDKYKNHLENKKISYNLKLKADKLVEKFTKKIDEKFEENSDKVKAIESVMKKLEEVANKNSKLENLVNYLNSKLKAQVEKYNDSFDEIEKLFQLD